MTSAAAAFRKLARPIMDSDAFRRLRFISFLGLLSPQYENLISERAGQPRTTECDRSRAVHSMMVAKIAYDMAENLDLSGTTKAYAVAWGLLHDIATWPLSHTAEAGFSRITQTSASDLRAMFMFGSYKLSERFSLYPTLKDLDIDPDVLVALFSKKPQRFDSDLPVLYKIIHSQITPDTLEGIYRTGMVFGLKVPNPKLFSHVISRDLLNDVWVKPDTSSVILEFWRSKSLVYSRFINTPPLISLESRWSSAVSDHFIGMSLRESLEVSERDIVQRVAALGLPKGVSIDKYKQPLRYEIDASYRQERRLPSFIPLESLKNILVKTRDVRYEVN